MFSLKKLFGQDEVFYDLLEASAQEAQASVAVVTQIISNLEAAPSDRQLGDLVLSRRKDKRITQEITEQLCRTFVTPLEREDIEALSSSLYKIPKAMVKISQLLPMCQLTPEVRQVISRQVSFLAQSTEVVLMMTKQLRKKPKLNEMQEMYAKLQYLEGEADKVTTELLGDIYTGKFDIKSAFAIKDLCDLLERAVDRCRDAGNTIFQIVLKHS